MLRIAVVEDDAPTREKLCTLIRDHAVSKGKDLAVTPLEDGSSLLGGALSGYDIIFLDIMLPTFLMRINHLWLLWLPAYAGQAAALLFLTRLRLPGAAYCAVWSMTLTQLSAEAFGMRCSASTCRKPNPHENPPIFPHALHNCF